MELILPVKAKNPSALSIKGNYLLWATIVLIVLQLLLQPKFATYQNFMNLSRAASLLAILSVGQMFVMLVRGFDLSIGATMAFTSIAVASVLGKFAGDAGLISAACIAVIAAVATGGLVGMVNGLLVAKLRVHSFIVTLGMSSIIVGAALWMTDGVPVYGVPRILVAEFGRGSWLGLSSFLWGAGLLIGILGVIYRMTRPGKLIMAVGRDQRSSELSGVRTQIYLVLPYVICSACAALGSMMLTAQIGSGQASIGTAFTFQSIAVCIIGGVSLLGGRASIVNVVIAAIFMQLLNNCFELLRLQSQLQAVIAGSIVIGVAIANLRKKD